MAFRDANKQSWDADAGRGHGGVGISRGERRADDAMPITMRSTRLTLLYADKVSFFFFLFLLFVLRKRRKETV